MSGIEELRQQWKIASRPPGSDDFFWMGHHELVEGLASQFAIRDRGAGVPPITDLPRFRNDSLRRSHLSEHIGYQAVAKA